MNEETVIGMGSRDQLSMETIHPFDRINNKNIKNLNSSLGLTIMAGGTIEED